mgnify:CR=1 FL=1
MKKSKTLFTVLFLGALWGILEATIGTILHLPVVHEIIFFASTAVMLPIAYLITGRAYKITGKSRTVLYVGLVAASIKSITFVLGLPVQYVINPMVAIILESSVMAVAFKVSKPENVCSLKSFATFVVASLAFRVAYVSYSMSTAGAFGSAYLVGGSIVWNEVTQYVITALGISCIYAAIYMVVGKAVSSKIPAKSLGKLQHFAYSPVFSIAMIAIAFAVTIIL